MHRMVRAVRRAQPGEIAVRPDPISASGRLGPRQLGLRHQGPDGGVVVLAAVLAHARRVGLDVAGAGHARGQRRVEQLDQAGVHGVVHQMPSTAAIACAGARAAPRPTAPPRPGRSGRCGLGVGGATRGLAVVEEGAAIPGAVPGRAVQRGPPARAAVSQRAGAPRVSPRLRASGAKSATSRHRNQASQTDSPRPSCRRGSCRRSSRRCPSAAGRARPPQAVVDGACGMLVHAGRCCALPAGVS
jgi:hypothetical protein